MKLILYNGQKNIAGERIRQLRKERKITQQQLARLVSAYGVYMDRITITKIETGSRVCFDFEVSALAQALGVGVQDLLADYIES